MLYADDNTDNTSDSSPEILQEKIQQEANHSTDWVSDNRMVCAGDKTKLLVIGTKQLRKSRMISKNKSIEVNVSENHRKPQ